MGYNVRVGVSNKHLHLTEKDLVILFGQGSKLTPFKGLVQPGQFASEEKVDIVGPRGVLKGVRIIGPTRPKTQVEISITDAYVLGIYVPVRESGKLEGTPGIKLIGPAGELDIPEGVMVAMRHIHLSPSEAEEAGLKNRDLVDVYTFGERPLIFQDVLIRSGDAHKREFHVDMDEANAAGIKNGEKVELSGPKAG